MATTPVFRMVPPWTPELLSSVQTEVETFLAGRGLPFVLEVGSGWSTVWLAERAGLIYSVEDDKGWRDEVERVLSDRFDKVCANRVDLVEGKHVPRWVSQQSEMYDLVLIDGGPDDTRLASLFASLTKVVDGGWIVLDDSHWEMFKGVPDVMRSMGYGSRQYIGDHTRKTGEVCFHSTTIFSKEFK